MAEFIIMPYFLILLYDFKPRLRSRKFERENVDLFYIPFLYIKKKADFQIYAFIRISNNISNVLLCIYYFNCNENDRILAIHKTPP